MSLLQTDIDVVLGSYTDILMAEKDGGCLDRNPVPAEIRTKCMPLGVKTFLFDTNTVIITIACPTDISLVTETACLGCKDEV